MVKDLEKYQKLLKEDKAVRDKAQKELRKLNRFIISCPDPVIRSIIINRYIKGLSWTAVAMKIGGNVTDDNCRKMLTRYLMKKK